MDSVFDLDEQKKEKKGTRGRAVRGMNFGGSKGSPERTLAPFKTARPERPVYPSTGGKKKSIGAGVGRGGGLNKKCLRGRTCG